MASSSDAGTQLKGPRALIGGNVNSVFESRVSFFFLGRAKQQQFAAFQLEHGVTPGLAIPFRNLICLGQQLEPSRTLSGLAMDAGEQAKVVRHPEHGTRIPEFL